MNLALSSNGSVFLSFLSPHPYLFMLFLVFSTVSSGRGGGCILEPCFPFRDNIMVLGQESLLIYLLNRTQNMFWGQCCPILPFDGDPTHLGAASRVRSEVSSLQQTCNVTSKSSQHCGLQIALFEAQLMLAVCIRQPPVP
jgi:hypothetical protein